MGNVYLTNLGIRIFTVYYKSRKEDNYEFITFKNKKQTKLD